MQETWRQANLAQAYLGQLPVSQNILANTSKFLAQVGDFSYAVNNKSMKGEQLSDKEFNTLRIYTDMLLHLGKSEQPSAGTCRMQVKMGRTIQKGPVYFKEPQRI